MRTEQQKGEQANNCKDLTRQPEIASEEKTADDKLEIAEENMKVPNIEEKRERKQKARVVDNINAIFRLCCLFGLLFGPCTAFLEVGVSSYLERTVHHVPEVGWTLVKPWNVISRKGFFEATASGGKGFSDSFVTPEPAIYIVALNLHMANTSAGFFKATLVINGEFDEPNGIECVYGNTTYEKTLSLSGFLRLYENDVLALYLHGSKGTVLHNSTFSVMQISRIGSVPGFHSVLSSDQVIQPQMKTRLENWRTSGTKGLFIMHSGTSPSIGLFCAIIEGIHLFTSNINVETNNQLLTHCLLAIVLNSNTTLVQKHSSGAMKFSIGLSGIFYLHRGDCVELRIQATSAGILTVQLGSGFSGLFLGIKREIAPQFSARLPADNQAARSIGWNRVENWSISSSRRNFQSTDMILKTNHSTFISHATGIFLVTAVVNINGSYALNRSSEYLLVAINDAPTGLTGNSGLSASTTLSPAPSSLSVSGVVWLGKGDTLTVYTYSDVHDRKINDGLFGVSLVTYDWPGVAATLNETLLLNSQGWTKVTSWKTHGVPGLFSFDNAFFPTNGVYRTHLDGTYFVSCNVIFQGYAKGNLSVIIAIDEVIDTGNGLFSLNENPKRYTTLNVAGSINLKKSQSISVYVAATESSTWSISMHTGFSLVLVGAESLSSPGFFAVKEEEASSSSSCGEIDRWRTITQTFNSFSHNGAQFNSTSGRFKAKDDGLYLFSANILIQHSGLFKMNMAILVDGQSSKTVLSTFQPKPSPSRSGAFVSTLTLAGTVRLIPEQYLSIFIKVQCQSASSWKVLGNSSFSVVFVSRWESDYAAGFLATTTSIGSGRLSFSQVYYWNATFSKNLDVTKFFPVEIKSSGLYFLQSVLILNGKAGNATFHSGIFINGTIAFNGITASKVSEGLTDNFVISAFGVLYLQRGQKVILVTRSETDVGYHNMRGSSFSMVRFLTRGQQPGLHQILQHVRNMSAVPCDRSVIRSVSTAGNQLAYINGNMFNPNPTLPCDKGDFTATFTGTYFISLIFTLRGNDLENVTACVGPLKCAECYIKVFITINQQNSTVGFTGLLDLKKSELISICLKSQDQSFSLMSATRSVQFLTELELNKTVQLRHRSVNFGSSGWHALVEWKNASGKSLQNISVIQNGLYILSTNMVMKAAFEGLVGLRLEATGSAHPEVLSVSSSAEAGSSVSFSVAVLGRLNPSEVITVSVYSNSNSLNIGDNSTFFAALITENNQHPCLSLRSKTSRYNCDEWWQGIEQWEDVDAKCLSPNSEFTKGRFVADVTGVYFVAVVVMVRTSSLLHQTRIVELLLSVNGDTANTNGLKATQVVTAGSSVVLSLSATVYLEPWQTLYPMIRSTGVGTLEVVNGSTFSVALIEGTKYYKTVARNVTHFDNGPRVICHPPPSVSRGDDLGLNISWTCDAIAKGAVTYKWLKNDQIIKSFNSLYLENVQQYDSGRYVCQAEYDGIKVFSQAANLDVFDTSPQFERKTFTASEDSNVFFVLTFTALNRQRKPANVSLVIVKGNTNNTFLLPRAASKENISLTNQIPFDYETTKLYHLTLVATNQDTNKTTTANVTVIITDVNDNPPIFTSRTNISVEEDVKNGTVIFQVEATDADNGNNSIISYTLLSSEYEGKFSIDASSGNITVIGNLDRENTSEVTLRIQATDGKFQTTTELVVIITDVNDNPPIFTSRTNISVEEDVANGTVIFQVEATDADYGNNSIISYTLLSSEYEGTFSIDPSSGNITVIGNLDRENTSEVTLRIQATDGMFKKTTELVVIITDVNDNPPIFTSRTNVSVEEDVANGTVIFQVEATDADYGNNSIISYTLLSGEYVGKFSIDASSGNITVIGNLDRENTSEVTLRIQATDGKFQTTTEIVVIIIDVNDNGPIFTSRTNISVEEDVANGTVIFQVEATDVDYGNNSIISYTLLSSEYVGKFSIDASSGNITVIGNLDRENTSEVTLRIQATDGKFQTTTELVVIITDVNDNSPIFTSRTNTSVEEDVANGTVIFQVEATDADYGNNSIISYTLLSSEYEGTFSIDASSGNITVIGNLDRENTSELTLRIQASDGKFQTTTELVVVITDVNDNPPIFTSRSNISVEENVANGTLIFQVKATDADYGNNSVITYTLLSSEYVGKFSIDASSGNITVIGNLDRENTSEVTLRIQATDGKFQTSTELVVIITDINDNGPIFTSRTNTSVEENVANGTVIFQVKATDADYDNNSIISYTLLPSEYVGKFSIDASSGNITVIGNLDRENTSEVTLEIQATDGKFKKTTELVITVLDVNEFPPVFHLQSYKTRISEAAPVDETVIQVIATDKDSGEDSSVFYSITSGNRDGTFSINAENGIIVLKKPLNYEAKKLYNLQVKATDNGIPSLESFTNVLVTVVDANDSPPVFTECEKIVTLEKPPQSATLLFRVSATDADHGSNANITYSIISGNDVEHCSGFIIHSDGGVYSRKGVPSRGGSCNITISATDGVWTDVCFVSLRVAVTEPMPDTGGFPEEAKYAVIAIAVILFVALVILSCWYCHSKRKKRGFEIASSASSPLSSRTSSLSETSSSWLTLSSPTSQSMFSNMNNISASEITREEEWHDIKTNETEV